MEKINGSSKIKNKKKKKRKKTKKKKKERTPKKKKKKMAKIKKKKKKKKKRKFQHLMNTVNLLEKKYIKQMNGTTKNSSGKKKVSSPVMLVHV